VTVRGGKREGFRRGIGEKKKRALETQATIKEKTNWGRLGDCAPLRENTGFTSSAGGTGKKFRGRGPSSWEAGFCGEFSAVGLGRHDDFLRGGFMPLLLLLGEGSRPWKYKNTSYSPDFRRSHYRASAWLAWPRPPPGDGLRGIRSQLRFCCKPGAATTRARLV